MKTKILKCFIVSVICVTVGSLLIVGIDCIDKYIESIYVKFGIYILFSILVMTGALYVGVKLDEEKSKIDHD